MMIPCSRRKAAQMMPFRARQLEAILAEHQPLLEWQVIQLPWKYVENGADIHALLCAHIHTQRCRGVAHTKNTFGQSALGCASTRLEGVWVLMWTT